MIIKCDIIVSRYVNSYKRKSDTVLGVLYQMDKRKEANIFVKKKITDTLFLLMRNKNIADISITEIIEQANVARASFYRNYSSKENVLIGLIHDALQKFLGGNAIDEIDCMNVNHLIRCFEFFKDYQIYVLGLYNSNYATVLLEELNIFHSAIAGSMPLNSIERYSIYTYIGSLFNTAIAWLKDGAQESPEDMARFFIANK